MNWFRLASLIVLGLMLPSRIFAGDKSLPPSSAAPVLVELFTSEGCSSCPPADAFLQQLDAQPIPGVQLIVLSEHVDYWNHIGWTDPFSSAAYSKRQSEYGTHFGLESVYTPQMVVDGSEEFVGANSAEGRKIVDRAATKEKIPVLIYDARLENGVLRAHVETDFSQNKKKADVFFVVALNHAESQVARGENSGRRLTHVAVVRNLVKVGTVGAGRAFSQEVSVTLPAGTSAESLRLIAFVQEAGPGRILGAALDRFRK
jgi:hypothetical protein